MFYGVARENAPSCWRAAWATRRQSASPALGTDQIHGFAPEHGKFRLEAASFGLAPGPVTEGVNYFVLTTAEDALALPQEGGALLLIGAGDFASDLELWFVPVHASDTPAEWYPPLATLVDGPLGIPLTAFELF